MVATVRSLPHRPGTNCFALLPYQDLQSAAEPFRSFCSTVQISLKQQKEAFFFGGHYFVPPTNGRDRMVAAFGWLLGELQKVSVGMMGLWGGAGPCVSGFWQGRMGWRGEVRGCVGCNCRPPVAVVTLKSGHM